MTNSNRIPIVIVGLNFGRNVVEELAGKGDHPHCRVAGLCDLDRPKAEALSRKYGGLRVYSGLDEVLVDPAVRAVGLFTDPVGRAQLIRRIITAGKDVMTTKPFETDPAAATAVLREAQSLGRVVHLNSPNPGTSPDLAAIGRWQTAHRLGRPVAVRADVWCCYRETADGSWYDDPARCPAPPVFRLGIYLINDLVRLFGRARRVSVFSTRMFTGRPTADNAQLAIEFENGALANVFASFCVRDGDHYRNSLTLNYENGTIYREVGPVRQSGEGETELSVVINDGVWQPRRVAASVRVRAGSGHYDWAGFAKAVRREADAPGYELEHIVEPVRIVAALGQAERSGSVVTLRREPTDAT